MMCGMSLLTSSTSATATMSLSATGSRNAPEPRGLAHAAREVAVERVGDAGEREQQARRRIRPVDTVDRTARSTSGIAKIRSQVSVFGRFQIIA